MHLTIVHIIQIKSILRERIVVGPQFVSHKQLLCLQLKQSFFLSWTTLKKQKMGLKFLMLRHEQTL